MKQSKKKTDRHQRKATEFDGGLDTEVELTDDDHKSKKQKTSMGHQVSYGFVIISIISKVQKSYLHAR